MLSCSLGKEISQVQIKKSIFLSWNPLDTQFPSEGSFSIRKREKLQVTGSYLLCDSTKMVPRLWTKGGHLTRFSRNKPVWGFYLPGIMVTKRATLNYHRFPPVPRAVVVLSSFVTFSISLNACYEGAFHESLKGPLGVLLLLWIFGRFPFQDGKFSLPFSSFIGLQFFLYYVVWFWYPGYILALRNELRGIPSFAIFYNWNYTLFYHLQNSSVRLSGPDIFFEAILNFCFNFFNGYRDAVFYFFLR